MKIMLSLTILLMGFQASKVYICKSGSGYAYHKKQCQGLSQCTRKIDTVTIRQAVNAGYKKACGYCY